MNNDQQTASRPITVYSALVQTLQKGISLQYELTLILSYDFKHCGEQKKIGTFLMHWCPRRTKINFRINIMVKVTRSVTLVFIWMCLTGWVCMPNMKSLSLMVQKLWLRLFFFVTGRQKHRQKPRYLLIPLLGQLELVLYHLNALEQDLLFFNFHKRNVWNSYYIYIYIST